MQTIINNKSNKKLNVNVDLANKTIFKTNNVSDLINSLSNNISDLNNSVLPELKFKNE